MESSPKERPVGHNSGRIASRGDSRGDFFSGGRQSAHLPEDPLVMEFLVAGRRVRRILIDTGSSADLITLDCLERLGRRRKHLVPLADPILGLGGKTITPVGSIRLPVKIGHANEARRLQVDFLVVDAPSSYNIIIGRPTLSIVKAVVAPYLFLMQYETDDGRVGKIYGDAEVAKGCYALSMQPLVEKERGSSQGPRGDERGHGPPEAPLPVPPVVSHSGSDDHGRSRPEPTDEVEHIPLDVSRPDRKVQIGKELGREVKDSLVQLLKGYADVFAYGPEEMPGISPEVMEHRLNVNSDHKPVKQKRRHQGAERTAAAAQEVQKLLEAGFVRECQYPDWLANVVLVKKANGTWRMCVYFTDLNKACPKDSYPLPKIDRLVDATAGHSLLSLMDAFSGYHQIPLCKEDQEKTSFITEQGLFCYNVMPFGLKNAGATYQRLVNKIFAELIGRSMEVYVDDMIRKSLKDEDHARDLENTFRLLRQYGMKLNPKKCTFGVQAGKFLGFMINQKGIEANSDKVKAILEMRSPRNVKEGLLIIYNWPICRKFSRIVE